MKSKQLVYISHPYGGNPENAKDIEKVIRHLYADERLYNNYCFVSPVHAFGFMYETEEYYRGLQMCIDLLAGCDQMLLIGEWETSKGCTGEKAYCDNNNIPYTMIRTSEELTHTSYDKILEILNSKKG